jgi:Ca-activated chloride channel family protein
MKFLWPSAFLLLSLIPLLILLFVWRRRRRRRFAVRYSSLSLVRAALPEQSHLRRYMPMALFFLALTGLVVSLARPVTVINVPAGRATVMLVLDVSSSMRQNDISPSRLDAAKEAALEFIDKQKDTNQVGIVAFASIAQLVQVPSTDPEELETTILNLTTGRGTAIGSGIVTALETIAEFNQNLAASSDNQASDPQATSTTDDKYQPDIIVLLTDGAYNTGIDPFEAAQLAEDNGVRVYTIGYGTNAGTSGRGGNFSGGFGGMNRGIDEEALEMIASMTGGEYYTASSANELQEVFDSLPTVLATREETVEISVAFAALAALLVVGAVLLSQLWHPLP